jgi:hypothetical protein
MVPRAEIAHWGFGGLFLLLALILLSEVVVGQEVFRRRRWRAYLWPTTIIVAGTLLWLVAIFSAFSTLHLLAHSLWAQAAMVAGGVQLALVRGKLTSQYWQLVVAAAMVLTGASFLLHEQNGWLFSRSAFLHHAIGWTMVLAALFPLGAALRPRARVIWSTGFALTFVLVAVFLFSHRDIAPIFGHLSEFARR